MDFDERETAQFLVKEASGDTHHTIMQAWTARASTIGSISSPSKPDFSSVPVSPAASSIGSMNKLNMQKSTARRSYRRKMVAECKGLRAQVNIFLTLLLLLFNSSCGCARFRTLNKNFPSHTVVCPRFVMLFCYGNHALTY